MGVNGLNFLGFLVGRRPLSVLLLGSLLLLLPVVASAIDKGQPAPDFTLQDLDGQAFTLSAFKGRVVLLKLATTWCPSCKQLSSEIEELGPYLKEKGVVFLDVYLQDTPAMVRKSLAGRNAVVEAHTLLDDGQAHAAYNVYVIPRLLIIDPQMQVAYDSLGQLISGPRIKALVENLLAPAAAKPAG
jgi:peroxiredoxin